MKIFKPIFLIFCSIILLTTTSTHAATFCVTTSAEFHTALDTADSNSQSDLIKIAMGTYTPSGNWFGYFGDESNANEMFDIEISGGWGFFFGNPCGRKADVSPFTTKLDGNFSSGILNMAIGATTNIKISNLSFINAGDSIPGHPGSGLTINADANTDITIENNAFINNTAPVSSSTLNIHGDETKSVNVNNNLFALNHSDNWGVISIGIHNNDKLFFINNTVVNNTTGTTNPDRSGGLTISGSGKSMVANNILWGNDIRDLRYIGSGSLTYLENNDIEFFDNTVDVEFGNISVPPAFEIGLLNYNLSPNSQLINAGIHPPNVIHVPPLVDETWALSSTDMLGDVRIQSSKVDIGAYESPYDFLDIIFENSFEFIN